MSVRFILPLLLALLAIYPLPIDAAQRPPSPAFQSLADLVSPRASPASPSSLSAAGCAVTANWTRPFTGSLTFNPSPRALFPSTCLLVSYTLDVKANDGNLIGLDIATGQTRWSARVLDGRELYGYFNPFVFNASTGEVFLTKLRLDGDNFCTVVMAGAVDAAGAQFAWRWSTQWCWDAAFYSATAPSLLLVPRAGGSVLVSVDGWEDNFGGSGQNASWTTLDAKSGKILHRETGPAFASGPATLRGEPSDGFFAVRSPSSLELSQLTSDGSWRRVHSTDLTGGDPLGGSTGLVQLMLSGSDLRGVDLRTGQQLWQSSNNSVATGAWVQNFTGFSSSARSFFVRQHPDNPDWALLDNRATNGQRGALFFATIIDVRTGATVASMKDPWLFSSNGIGEVILPAIQSVGGVLMYDLSLDSGPQWMALDGRTLAVVSTGAYVADDKTWVSVDGQGATAVYAMRPNANGIAGARFTADADRTESS